MDTPDFSGKRILFTGFSVSPGSEAVAGYSYVKRYGATDITVIFWGPDGYEDKLPDDITAIRAEGKNKFDPSLTEGYDLVFRQNAIRPDLIKSPTTTNTNEFFRLCPAPIIAVTGTKGKGTTTTLTARILEAAGKKVHLLGNIGTNALEHIGDISGDDIVVFEISSFQLWDIQTSPHVAVFLMMAEDHQDVHNSIDEYIEAKAQIVRYQTVDDVVIYHPTNQMTAQGIAKAKSRRKKFLTNEAAFVNDGLVVIDGQSIMPVSEVGLIGKHNLENVAAAITAAWEYTQDVNAIAQAVKDFKGLEHRLEEVATMQGVTYFNDSFSTASPAAKAALEAFSQPTIAILGGYDKQTPMNEIADAVVSTSPKQVILMGQTGPAIKKFLDERGFTNYTLDESKDIEQIVRQAAEVSEPGDVVVFSPGCASFDMFNNYKERGKLFKDAVHKLND